MQKIRAARFIIAVLGLFVPGLTHAESETPPQNPAIEHVDVFTSGTDGYAIFRIPSIITTTSGTLLAFAEGRVNSGADTGNIDLVLRRSFDNGATWGPLQVIWDDAENTCGNPAPVVDRETGRIVLLMTWNRGDDHEKDISERTSRDTRRVFVAYSTDDGESWTDPQEITADVKKPNWRWYATGPVHAIQMKDGRLVVPCNHTEDTRSDHSNSYSHVIISTDGGDTWTLGGSTGRRTNESTVVELDDGRLMLNSRSYHNVNRRAISWSSDGGMTWDGPYLHPDLIEPVCQASMLKIPFGEKSAYLFSNPPSKDRENMTVRISTDAGMSWSSGLRIYTGFSAYSDLVMLPGNTVGCLYERDSADGRRYGRITLAKFPLDLLRQTSQE